MLGMFTLSIRAYAIAYFVKDKLFFLSLRKLGGAKHSHLRGPEGPALRHIQEELVVITRLSWGHIWGQAEKLLNI